MGTETATTEHGDVDPRLVRALERQMASRRAALDGGARHVGWKLGTGDAERIGSGPVIGHLTSDSLLPSGSLYLAAGEVALRADVELALELGDDGEIVGCGAALEIVDVDERGGPEEIVAGNVFHRAVAFGPTHPATGDGVDAATAEGQLIVNGRERGRDRAPTDHRAIVRRTAELLAAVGEELRPGDRILTGAIVQVAVRPGNRVVADLGALGRAELRIAPAAS